VDRNALLQCPFRAPGETERRHRIQIRPVCFRRVFARLRQNQDNLLFQGDDRFRRVQMPLQHRCRHFSRFVSGPSRRKRSRSSLPRTERSFQPLRRSLLPLYCPVNHLRSSLFLAFYCFHQLAGVGLQSVVRCIVLVNVLALARRIIRDRLHPTRDRDHTGLTSVIGFRHARSRKWETTPAGSNHFPLPENLL
jgi:hypothetical protein